MAKKKNNDAPENGEGQSAPKKGGKLKLIIIAVILLAVLGGGGFVAYGMFFSAPPVEPDAKAAEEKAAGPENPAPVLQELDTFLVNLADEGGKRYLKVTMQLALEDPGASASLEQRSFEVRDRILMVLASKEYNDVSTYAGKMLLKRQLITQLNRLLGGQMVREIYFTDFLVQ